MPKPSAIRRYRTIDAHAAGEPLRLIVEGYPAPKGGTMLEKRAWVKRHADAVRRALMLEPRGHADMYGAVLTEPVTPEADAGVLFMHNEGYSTMCGHGIVAVTTIAIERGLIHPRVPNRIVYDSPAGPVRARASTSPKAAGGGDRVRVDRVAFDNVPSFVLAPGLPVRLGAREVRVDVAFGGAFYAIVDAEAAGLPITPARLPELRRAGMEIKHAVEAAHHGRPSAGQGAERHLRHHLHRAARARRRGPEERDDLRGRGSGSFALRHGHLRGDGGASTPWAVMPPGRPFGHESLIGTLFNGRITGRTRVGDFDAILPELEGSAWITGEHVFLVDDEDPLKGGFRL